MPGRDPEIRRSPDLRRLARRQRHRRAGALRRTAPPLRPARISSMANRLQAAAGQSSSGNRRGQSPSLPVRTPRTPTTWCPWVTTCSISLHEPTAVAGPSSTSAAPPVAASPPERSQFHAPEDWLAPARSAAPEGEEPDLVPVVVKPGGGSFHHGLPGTARRRTRRERGADGARVAHAPRRGPLPRDDVDLIYRATVARATGRSTRCSARSCRDQSAIGRRGCGSLPDLG